MLFLYSDINLVENNKILLLYKIYEENDRFEGGILCRMTKDWKGVILRTSNYYYYDNNNYYYDNNNNYYYY